MSGQPVRTPADVNKFRNEYLQNLSLQEEINDMNLQANKTYLLTGQLPPQSQMQDTRTTSEKLKDVELLKHKIANDLSPLAEPQFCYEIVNAVMNSSLNVDGGLIRFLAQRASSIAEQLKKNYAIGIAGDKNDLEIIVQFIKNMYSDQQGKFQSVKTYIQSQSSHGTRNNVLNANDIDVIIMDFQEFIKEIENINSTVRNDFLITNRVNILSGLNEIRNILLNAKSLLPTTTQIDLLMKDLSSIDTNNNLGLSKSDIQAFFKALEDLPKASEIKTLLQKCKKFLISKNYKLLFSTIEGIKKELSILDLTNEPLFNSMRNILNRQRMKEQQILNINETQTREFIRQQDEEERKASKATKVYVVNPENDPAWVQFKDNDGSVYSSGSSSSSTSSSMPSLTTLSSSSSSSSSSSGNPLIQAPIQQRQPTGMLSGLNNNPLFQRRLAEQANELTIQSQGGKRTEEEKQDLENRVDAIIDNLDDFGVQELYNIMTHRGLNPRKVKWSLKQNLHNEIRKENNPYNLGDYHMVEGLGMKKRRGRPRGSGLVKVPPVPKPPNFVGFGINEINQKNLEKGILTVRRNTKTNYMDMPSRRVSNNMKNIIKTIIGGGVPKYEELGKLDEDEKEYLYKLVNKSNLEDRLSVPAPSKDQEEKDIHNFEVMRGQIMAGNDSVELVKKFKLLIRKLSKQGLLPKNDVDDLMETLITLGY